MHVKIKLTVILLISVLMPPAAVCLAGHYGLGLPFGLSLLAGGLPILSMLFAIVVHLKKGPAEVLAQLRYCPAFPAFFFFEPDPPRKYAFGKTAGEVGVHLKDGDVLLRRMEHYVSGLVLEQCTYFTHAALFFRDEEGQAKVVEAVGSNVRIDTFENFAKCDDLVALRPDLTSLKRNPADHRLPQFFLTERHPVSGASAALSDEEWSQKINSLVEAPAFAENSLVNLETFGGGGPFISREMPQEIGKGAPLFIDEKKEGGVFSSNPQRVKDVKKFLQQTDKHASGRCKTWWQQEIALFKAIEGFSGNARALQQFLEQSDYKQVVIGQARCLEGVQYDFAFDFTDFEKMSCVELVWYCYRALFRCHRIVRKKATYFNWIRPLILVPDQFLSSSFFKVVDPPFEEQEVLAKLKQPRLHYWTFLLWHFLSLLLVLALTWGLYAIMVQVGRA